MTEVTKTFQTEVNGKAYTVVVNPELINKAFGVYVQVYKTRKDGSRGRKLMGHHVAAWAAWQTVKAEALK